MTDRPRCRRAPAERSVVEPSSADSTTRTSVLVQARRSRCHGPRTSTMSPGSRSVTRNPRSALRRRTDTTVSPFHVGHAGKHRAAFAIASAAVSTTLGDARTSRLMTSALADVLQPRIRSRGVDAPAKAVTADLLATDRQACRRRRGAGRLEPLTRPDCGLGGDAGSRPVSASSSAAVMSSPEGGSVRVHREAPQSVVGRPNARRASAR